MNKTLRSYNKFASEYDKTFSNYTPYQKQITNFIDVFSQKAIILDMGCGTGLNSRFFSNAGHIVYGFDFSKAMVEIAEKNCPNGNFSVSTIKDYNSLMKFDGICLSFIIVHLPDEEVENLINRLSGLLNSNGWVYISFMTGKKSGYETTSFSTSEIYFNYFKTQHINNLFEKNGFSLEYSCSSPYSEPDGTTTEDVFLIFQKCDNLVL